MKRFLLFAMAIVFAMQLSAQETTYAVGEYGTSTSYYVPVNNFFKYSYTQSIYPADSLEAGLITAISYKYAHTSSCSVNPSTIYVAEVSRSTFASSTDYEPLSNLTQVFSGSVTYSQGWVRIDFDQPFNYTGEGNLLVAYLNETGDYPGSAYDFNTFSRSSGSIDYYSDNSPISPSSPSATSNQKRDFVPCTKFHVWPNDGYCYPPENVTARNITQTEAEITWTTNENATSSEYGIAYKAQDSDEWIELESSLSAESYTITDLDLFTRYDVKVWTVCSDSNSREIIRSFVTNPEESLIQYTPYEENFDNIGDISEWTITNGTALNQWHQGTAVNNTLDEYGEPTWEGGAMYISNDNGVNNSYTISSASTVYFSTIIGFGDAQGFELSFDRRQAGQPTYDYTRVYLLDADAELSNASIPNTGAITDILQSTTSYEWERDEVFIPATYANTVKKLVFMWTNNAYTGTQPPAAIDNISIRELSCGTLSDVAVETTDMDGYVETVVTFNDPNEENISEYVVEYKLETESTYSYYTTTDYPVVVPDLLYGSRYELRVIAVCNGTDSSFVSETIVFNTPCAVISEFPYVTNFEESFIDEDGVIGNREAPICWYNINGGYSSYYWNRTTTASNVFNGAASLYLSGSTSTTTNYDFSEWFISPVFALTGGERLNFMAKATNTIHSPVLKIYAKDVSDGDITTMADTSGFTLVQSVPLTISDNFEFYEVYLDAFSGNTRFALVVNQMSSSFYLDSLAVREIPDCPDVYDFSVSAASLESASVNLNTDNSNGSGWVIAYGQAESIEAFDPESAETVTVSDAEEFPYIIEGLNSGETYYFAAKQDCGGNFTSTLSALIPTSTITLPYYQNFDDPENMAEITIDNDTATNKWHYGTVVNNTFDDNGMVTSGGGAMYISDNDGQTNSYTITSAGTVYFSTIIEFGDAAGYLLSFDRKQAGESTYDYTRVYLIDLNVELGTDVPNVSNAITDKLKTTDGMWERHEIYLDDSWSNTVKRLVFMWSNDGSMGTQPPAAIDNISLVSTSCGMISDVNVQVDDEEGSLSATLTFSDPNESTSEYIVEYKSTETSGGWTSFITTNYPIVLTDLDYSTNYDLLIRAVCNDADTSFVSDTVSISTPCGVITNLPYVMCFEDAFTTADGVIGDRVAPRCWYNINDGYSSYYWNRGTTTSYLYDGDAYLYFSGTTSTSTTYDFSDWVISPVFGLTGGERLNFMARATSATNAPVLKIYAKDVSSEDISSAADTSSFTLVQTIPFTMSENYQLYEVDLSDYSGNTRLALVINQPSSSLYLDSLVVSAMPDCPDVYGFTVYPASSTGVEFNVNTDNSGDHGWTVAYGQAESIDAFDPTSAETVTVYDAEELPYVIDGLNTGETYYFAAQHACDGAFTSPVAVTIPATVTVPWYQNFDDAENMAEIIIDNNDAVNQWHHGTIVNNTVDETGIPTSGGAMYISENNGTTNTYNTTSASTVYFSTIVEFDESLGYILTFDRNQAGQITYDYTRVYLLDLDEELSSSTVPNVANAVTDILQTTNGVWVTDTVILDGSYYANTTKKLVFMWTNNTYTGTQPPAAIDNIRLEAQNCVAVNNLGLSVYDADGSVNVTVQFEDPNESGDYIIEYKASGDAAWTTLTNISDNPYTIEGLAYETIYDVRVQALCSEGSSVFTYASINTACMPLSPPWVETFESDVTSTPTCWGEGDGLLTATGTIQTSSLTTPSGWAYSDVAVGGITDGRMKLNVYSTATARDWLITPSIDLGDGSTVYQLAVDVMLKDYGTNNDNDPDPAPDDRFGIFVSTDNGTTFSTANAIIFADGDEDTEHNYSDLGRTPTRVIYKLVDADDNPITGQVKFAFYGESTVTNGDNDLFIDNVEVSEWTECQAPYGVTVSNIGYNSANVSFVEAGEATEWEYVLVEEGGDMETADAVAVYENPIELAGLDALTTYTIAVRSVCSDGSISSWSMPVSFTTKCAPSELPWTEGFEDITVNNELPACMEATRLGTYVQTYTSAQSNYNRTARTGSKFASFRYSSNDYIFTPLFELTGGIEYTFAFWYVTDGRSGWTTLEAKLCSGQTESDILSTIGTSVTSPANETYQQYVATFIPEEDGVYSIAIHCAATTSPWYLSIDDLSLTEGGEVVEPELCVEPIDLTVANVTETTAELTWTAGGSESSWQVRLGEDGEAVDVTATSHTFTELTAGTQYTAYVRANCGESYSSWVSVAFTTASEGVVNPVVTTVAASNVTETEATLNATVVEGTETITARGFKYKTTESTDWTDVAATGTTTLTATLTDLIPATSYEFKAYVTVGTEEFEGAVLTFTTESEEIEIVMGTVETNEASNINDHTAVLNGTLTSNGGDDSYTVGFLMSTMEDFDMETPNVVNLSATENSGALTANATELESGTNYFFRAYITNDAGTAYGEVKTFVTTSGLSDAEGGLRAVIYPNPASGKATVEIEGLNESARLIVTDLQGRVLSSDDLQSGASRYEMDLTGFASGVYYIRIVTDNSVSTRKLIVK